MGGRARHPPGVPPRRALAPVRPSRHRHRGPRPRLRRRLPEGRPATPPLLLGDALLHGRHARPRPRRRRDRPLRVLGAHERQLVPAHRLRPRAGEGAQGGPAGALRDRRRRPRAPRRPPSSRRGRGHAAAVGARRAGGGDPGPRPLPPRPPPRPARGLHEVGPVPFPLLAAGRHGRAQPGERVPALGHDGEGGDLPPRPPQPRPRRDRRLALPGDPRRHRDPRHRGRPRLRPDRPQAAARLHDLERARDADRARGDLDRALRPGGDGVPARPRPLQGGALPRGGGDRPRGGDTRRAAPRRARAGHAPDRLRRRGLRALDGGAASLLRLRGEGALLRGEAGGAARGGPPGDGQLRGERPRGGGGRARGLAALLREGARDAAHAPTRRRPPCGWAPCSSPRSAWPSACCPTSSPCLSSSPRRARCAASTPRSCSAPGSG